MADPILIIERLDSVGVVTLNRPAALNALSNQLLAALADALAGLDDENVGAIVVTGGPKVFAAGADLKALDEQLRDRSGLRDFLEVRFRCWDRLRALRCPTIAAVAGYALGAGCELALSCDLVVAAESARFGLPEVGLGVAPGAGGTQRLARRVGKARAMELVLTGRLFDAYEAERLGLVNRVVPSELVRDEALALAQQVAAQPPLAVRLAKAAILQAFELPLTEGLRVEREVLLQLLATEDAREGVRAFIEKRAPVFHGR